MTNSQIRAEIVELINGGMLQASKVAAFFKKNHPSANLNVVKEEAKELITEVKMVMKRGY